jgi:predicted protein tyrosine phosphatase
VDVPDLPTCVEKGLYLGRAADASKGEVLELLGIGAVLSVSSAPPRRDRGILSRLKLEHIDLEDSPDADLFGALARACAFLRHCRREGVPTLVHCRRGVSRSPAVIAHFLASDADQLVQVEGDMLISPAAIARLVAIYDDLREASEVQTLFADTSTTEGRKAAQKAKEESQRAVREAKKLRRRAASNRPRPPRGKG